MKCYVVPQVLDLAYNERMTAKFDARPVIYRNIAPTDLLNLPAGRQAVQDFKLIHIEDT
ncbi:MAG: hypothetical protein U5K51_08670 [Flavobacteriaceae bacterium]|nr:hypothetical protein [Flavobacteriaceae bacterium]